MYDAPLSKMQQATEIYVYLSEAKIVNRRRAIVETNNIKAAGVAGSGHRSLDVDTE